MSEPETDLVDHVVAQTRRERPDLDATTVELLSRLTRAGRLVETATARSLAPYGVGLGEFWLLVALRRAGPPFRCSPSELHATATVTSGAISQQLERLERRKLVRRRPHPNDRRGVLVELTAAGRVVIDEAWAAHITRDEALFSRLTPTQRRTLADLLRQVVLAAEAEKHMGTRSNPSRAALDGSPVSRRDNQPA